MSSLKLIFAGTPEFAARHLDALLTTGNEICAVYTQPDRPAGRGKKLTASPVKAMAVEHGIPLLQPASLAAAEAQTDLAKLDCDLMVVVAYGLLLPTEVLEIPKHGCVNVHGSILPRWRGAAPIQRAIEAGDSSSGVTIMQMDAGLDTGDMLLKRDCPIYPTDTAADLHDRLSDIGPPLLIEALDVIFSGRIRPEKQDNKLSTYAHKIAKSEAKIDWSETAETIHRKIRAFNPFPVCFSSLHNERLRILEASPASGTSDAVVGELMIRNNEIFVQCGAGQLMLKKLQPEGKKVLTASEFLNGFGHRLVRNGKPVRLGDR